jgi:hypothetical protein
MAIRLLVVGGRETILTAAVLIVLLGTSSPTGAQPGVDLSTSTPPSERQELRGIERPSPEARGDDPRGQHTPVFIGPTLRGETTEFGVSAWIAPETPVGGLRSGGGELNGWASLGLTFTWGGPRPRPSAGVIVR